MDKATVHKDVLKKLREHGGQMWRTDLFCSLTSGERLRGNLLILIREGLETLVTKKKVVVKGDFVKLRR